jgi:hypothetical protein
MRNELPDDGCAIVTPMVRLWLVVGLCACDSGARAPAADKQPVATPVATVTDAPIVAPPADAAGGPADAAPDALVATATTRRAPGLYPVLVAHAFDKAPHAYILACAQVSTDKPPKLLSPAACANVLGKEAVELVAEDGTRTTVTLGKTGKGAPCPGDGPSQPWRAVQGLPSDRDRSLLILPTGIALDARAVDRATMFRLKKRHVVVPKNPSIPTANGGEIPIRGQVDLDGDGVLEIITDHLGSVRLFRGDATIVGEVGCQFI